MSRLVPPGAAERTVDLDEGPLRALVGGSGDGVPLVLIHGGGTDNAGISWFNAFEAFGGRRRVVGLDLPGFGGSIDVEPVGGPGPMADLVVRALPDLGVRRRAVFVGVSMGGDVALNVALRHPEAVDGLVLVAPGGLAGRATTPAIQFAYWWLAQLPDAVLLPFARLANRFTRAAMHAMVHDPESLPPAVADEFVREASDPRAARGYMRYNQATLGRAGMRNNLLPYVQAIEAPALFFHGEDDPIVDPGGSRRAVERMPHARLVLVPRTGHWAQLEAPERFADEVRAFLDEVDAAT